MPVLKDYTKFLEVVQEIIKLECHSSCREGGGNPACQKREYVLNKKHAIYRQGYG